MPKSTKRWYYKKCIDITETIIIKVQSKPIQSSISQNPKGIPRYIYIQLSVYVIYPMVVVVGQVHKKS